jgi:3-dehydroquinate synthetase
VLAGRWCCAACRCAAALRLAECIKHALIRDPALFDFGRAPAEAARSSDPESLATIARNVAIRRRW